MALAHGTKIVRDGLVLYLDAANPRSYSGTGTDWFDLSVIGGNATAYNNPTFSNKSFNFDGVSDYFRIVRDDLNGGSFDYTNITVELWIKPSSTGSTGGTGNNLITVENTFEISIGNLNNGYSSVQYASVPWAWKGTSEPALTNDIWNLLTFTHASVGRKLYVNGVEIFSSTDSGNLGIGSASYPYLTLMGRYSGTGSQAEGELSVVKLYSRVLTETEIVQTFNAMKGRYGL